MKQSPFWEAKLLSLSLNFPTFYLTQRFVTMFMVAYHLFLSWVTSSPCSPILYSFKQELIQMSYCTTDICILPYISTLQGITHKIEIIFLLRANIFAMTFVMPRSLADKRDWDSLHFLYCLTTASLKCLCNHSLPQKVGRIKLIRTEVCRKWRNCFFMQFQAHLTSDNSV